MTTYTNKVRPMSDVLAQVPRLTVKGEAIHRLADNLYGTDEVAVLRLAANVVDRETITITSGAPFKATRADAFQIVVINTDTTANSTVLDSTSAADVVETIASHGLTKGAILRCESEFLLVKEVKSANTVLLERGYAGSTIASHADGSDIFKKGATALTAAKIYVPISGTLTPAAAGPELAAGLTALNTLGWTFTYTANTLTGFRRANGYHDTLAETLSGTDNVWAAAASWGGFESGQMKRGVAIRVPTASEVALGVLAAQFPFTVAYARVTVFTTSTGAPVAFGGTIAWSGGKVTLTNGTDPDFSANETVVIEAFGV